MVPSLLFVLVSLVLGYFILLLCRCIQTQGVPHIYDSKCMNLQAALWESVFMNHLWEVLTNNWFELASPDPSWLRS